MLLNMYVSLLSVSLIYLLLSLSVCSVVKSQTIIPSSSPLPSTSLSPTSSDLLESESKDPGKVEIIKQIKRVNDDGSYTFGYEADDGTFKIESRDVLGNIKGTVGFVDPTGTIKRVSYTSTNNGTTTSSTPVSTPVPMPTQQQSVIQQIPRVNRTMKRVPYSSVIQSITNRKRFNLTATGSAPTTTSTERPSYKNLAEAETIRHLNGHYITEGQLIRPALQEQVTVQPYIVTTIKPEYDMNSILRRRQLNPQEETQPQQFDTRQHVLALQQSLGHDATDVYSASVTTGTSRPLFTTTTPPAPIQMKTFVPAVYTGRNYIRVHETPEQEPQSQPIPIPLVAIRHPYQDESILIPVNQLPLPLNEIIDNNNNNQVRSVPYPYSHPNPRFMPRRLHVNPNLNPNQNFNLIPSSRNQNGPIFITVNDLQDEIDNIKPPVTTNDFQKLLNRLIQRQSHLQEINRLERERERERIRMLQTNQPISVFYRKPIPIPIPYHEPEMYRRRVARYQQESESESESELESELESNNILPAEVREMLLLRMLQLAINPNLPLPPDEGQAMVNTIQQQYHPQQQQRKKEAVRNVEILGEEPELIRNKRHQNSQNFNYYSY